MAAFFRYILHDLTGFQIVSYFGLNLPGRE